jgi:hypothetical protein
MLRLAAVAALCLAASGCGGKMKFVPVSGRVTMGGQPLANVRVQFQPVEGENPGPCSVGDTDSDGRFTLKVSSQQWSGNGAVVGRHRVSIGTILPGEGQVATDASVGTEDGAPLAGKELIPPKYNQNSELYFEVPKGGTDQADFDLGLPGKAGKKP